MLILLEIILTFFVWQNGWKWLSLLPIMIGIGIAILVSIFFVLTGKDLEVLNKISIIFDLIVIGILIVMTNKEPKSKQQQN